MNVLCLGGRTVGPAVAWDIAQNFLAAEYSCDERHLRRLRKVALLEMKGHGAEVTVGAPNELLEATVGTHGSAR
jgi:hypothetical protein